MKYSIPLLFKLRTGELKLYSTRKTSILKRSPGLILCPVWGKE